MNPFRLTAILGGLAASAVCVAVVAFAPSADAQDQPGDQPQQLDRAVLRWEFTEGMTLQFAATANMTSISSVRGGTEGSVLRLVSALTHADPQIREQAADILKKGGRKVLVVLEDYVTNDSVPAEEKEAIRPLIVYLRANPDGDGELPDRIIFNEREGRTTCMIDWRVERFLNHRATVWTKSYDINVNARARQLRSQRADEDPARLDQQPWETATFRQGQTSRMTPDGRTEILKEPDNPIASLFFFSMNLDYRFTLDTRAREVMDFRFTDEMQDADRRAMNLTDPLQIGPSFRRLSGRQQRVGDEWEITFAYFAGGQGTRNHICKYKLTEIRQRGGRTFAVMPWTEVIYSQPPRANPPGTIIGGGSGEFHMDINDCILLLHRNEIAYEQMTLLEVPRRDAPTERRDLETYFTMILKLEMRLNRVEKP